MSSLAERWQAWWPHERYVHALIFVASHLNVSVHTLMPFFDISYIYGSIFPNTNKTKIPKYVHVLQNTAVERLYASMVVAQAASDDSGGGFSLGGGGGNSSSSQPTPSDLNASDRIALERYSGTRQAELDIEMRDALKDILSGLPGGAEDWSHEVATFLVGGVQPCMDGNGDGGQKKYGVALLRYVLVLAMVLLSNNMLMVVI